MNRILCIMKDLESGITLMKDKNDTKNWTKADLLRMKRKNLVQGYDVAYDNQFVIFDTSEVQYMYLVDAEKADKIASEPTAVDMEEDDTAMKWSGAQPQPYWNSNVEDRVMFQ